MNAQRIVWNACLTGKNKGPTAIKHNYFSIPGFPRKREILSVWLTAFTNTKRQERRFPKIPGFPTYLLSISRWNPISSPFFLGQTSLRSHINMKLAFSGEKQKVRFHIVISYFLEIFNHSVKILSSCLEVWNIHTCWCEHVALVGLRKWCFPPWLSLIHQKLFCKLHVCLWQTTWSGRKGWIRISYSAL